MFSFKTIEDAFRLKCISMLANRTEAFTQNIHPQILKRTIFNSFTFIFMFFALVVKLCGDYLKKRSKFTHVNYKTSKERRQCKDESLFTCLSLSVCVLAQIYLILSPFECEIYFPIRKILITHGIFWLFRSLRKKFPKRVASAENMWHLYSASKDTEKRFGGVFFCYFSVHSIFWLLLLSFSFCVLMLLLLLLL